MDNQIFTKQLTELIKQYYPEVKMKKQMVEYINNHIRNTINNHNCNTCSESESESVKPKKKYIPKQWTCEYCDKTMTTKNKVNHQRKLAHQRKVQSSSTSSEGKNQ